MSETEILQGKGPDQKAVFIDAGTPVGYQQLTVNTAVGLTVPSGANKAIIISDVANMRWRDDGTDPTASVGMNLLRFNVLVIESQAMLDTIKFIKQDSTNGVLNISYYARK